MPTGVTNLRFLFLGTGTSGGIPLIACACAACTSTDPRDRRTRTGAAVQWVDPGGTPRTVLIDATPDLRAQALRHRLWRCDAIVFTHNHVDHIFGLDEVRRFNAVMKAPIDVYAERYVLESLRRVYKHVFEKDQNVNDSFVASLIAHEIPAPPESASKAAAPIELWGLSFTPVRLLHGRLPILGFRIEAPWGADEGSSAVLPLAYCTDVSSIPPTSWRRLTGLRTLVLDALRIRTHATHFNLAQATSAALEIGAGATYFVHMAHEIVHAAIDAELPEGMHLAYDGLTLGSALTPERERSLFGSAEVQTRADDPGEEWRAVGG